MRNDEQEKPKVARRTVSLDPELDAFALRRMKERGLTMFSHYVQDLVRRDTAALRSAALGAGSAAALLNEEPGNPQALPHTGAEILRPRQGKGYPLPHTGGNKAATSKTVKGSESSVGGSSTATSKRSLKTG